MESKSEWHNAKQLKRKLSKSSFIANTQEDSDDMEESQVPTINAKLDLQDEPFSKVAIFREQCDEWLTEMAEEMFADIVFSYLKKNQSEKKESSLVVPLGKAIGPPAIKNSDYKHNQKNLVGPVRLCSEK